MSSLNESVEGNAALQNAICNRLDQNISSYVDRYRGFTKKSAENTIEMARCFFEAKTDLDDPDFDVFCDKIGIDKKGSTSRKLKTIGENAATLMNYVDLLPGDWTTIYFLATFAKDHAQIFHRLMNEKSFKPCLTLKQIKKLAEQRCGYVDKKAKEAPQSDATAGKSEGKAKMSISIILDGLVEERAREVYAEIISLQKKFDFEMIPTKRLEELKNTVH